MIHKRRFFYLLLLAFMFNNISGSNIKLELSQINNIQYIKNALSPAEIMKVEINEEDRQANVQVEQDQLSLAIGKQGQNVRLASQLTGYKINITEWSANYNDLESSFSKTKKEEPKIIEN